MDLLNSDRLWLVPSGRMGKLIADHPWGESEFGSLGTWPSHLRAAVNLMLGGGSAMVIIWGAQRRLLYNDKYREIIQDKHPRALGERGEVIFPEVWPDVELISQRAYAGEGVVIEDMPFRLTRGGETKDGYFSGSYNPIFNEAGEVDGLLGIFLESTTRVEREQQRAQVFETYLSAMQDFAYSLDREGRFLYANRALLNLWGIDLKDALGKTFEELNNPHELSARLHRQVQEVFEAKRVIRDEAFYTSPTGVVGYYEYIFSPVFAADGSVAVIAGCTRDITARKKLEFELRDIQSRLEATLAAGAIGTWSWDVLNDRVSADRVLAGFFSVSDDVAKGGHLESYLRAIHPEDREPTARIIQEVLDRGGSTYEAEYRVVDPAGGIRWLAARASIHRDAKANTVIMPGLVIDITQRKHLEQRLQETIRDLQATQRALEKQAGALEGQVRERTARLEEMVGELEAFSYSVSHDLRGPLRVMQSFAQALREDCGAAVGTVGEDYIRRIVAAAGRMDRIIQDVLVYSRIARTDLALEPLALDDFVRSLLEGYPAFHEHRDDIVVEEQLPVVCANPAALTQCIANLIGNAIKFVAQGTRPRVHISSRVEGGRVFVSIRDNGIGIPPEQHTAIFDAFHRLEPRYEGTGIGLAIVRKAINRMGGQITVDSAVGRGSTFTFDLPLGELP